MENKDDKLVENNSRIIKIAGVDDRVLRNESNDENEIIVNDRPLNAENAVPPKAWENQKKAYNDAWENNKNQAMEGDL
ncbi:hypothetical protein [Kaistella yonginensis]|uniref:hypothetical protein n=1 Tax=Kaistella yonginensis TaxID=658267 RepID=UPI0025B3913B|nr:hypothetical protein [Kaistella yonginensis]MDN3607983.1 hypothetical protein [Kaistella yonginensis]